MNKIMKSLISNPATFQIAGLLLYLFYGLLIGIALIPSALLVTSINKLRPFNLPALNTCLLALGIGTSVYLFFIAGVIVFGATGRLLSLGFRPGKYKTTDPTFYRWLIYGGIHTISINLILPYVMGSGIIRLYFKLLGCKMGKDVFINTVGLHDSYLLTIGDNVVIGGKTDITCHIFEGGYLILDRITIGSNVMIGANTYIMPGASVGSNSSIGANSQIRKNKKIDEKSLILPLPGLPAKQIARIMNIK
ncbi:MAG: hypothetical protein LBV08_08135 [Clostridiales bacterium]|jgi:acetyltransferase-like isoleucine patch superfamily enzyme|nr:hypothetical protein [Clostridiales bacterium]